MATDTPSGIGRKFRFAGLQFLTIFFAVSLSFVADDWRQQLDERRQERRALQGIKNDLTADSGQVDWHVRTHARVASAALWLHENWDREQIPLDSINWALSTVHLGSPYSPVRSEYEAAKAAGRLQLMQNHQLREALASYYERYQEHQVRVNDVSIDFDFEFWRMLRPYVTYETEFRASPVPSVRLVTEWPDLQENIALRSALVHMLVFRRLASLQFTSYVERSNRLRALIAEDLN